MTGGKFDKVKFFIEKASPEQLNVVDDKGYSLLYYLLKKSGGTFNLAQTYKWDDVEYIIKNGANIYSKGIKDIAGTTWWNDMVKLQPLQSGGRRKYTPYKNRI